MLSIKKKSLFFNRDPENSLPKSLGSNENYSYKYSIIFLSCTRFPKKFYIFLKFFPILFFHI